MDVYEDTSDESRTVESTEINPLHLDTYGYHKRLAELTVMRRASNWQIFRLGQMVGTGLVKGPVFDLLQDQLIRISQDSEFPFLRTKSMAKAIFQLIGEAPDKEVFNICGVGSVTFGEVMKRFPATQATINPDGRRQIYRISTDKTLAFCDLPKSQDEITSFLLQKA